MSDKTLAPGYKWWALSATSVGMLMAVLNGTTLLIALPTLIRVLHMNAFLSMWVLLTYMVVQTALVLTVGRLSDVLGRKRLYVAGFAIFTMAALVAGLAPDGTVLLVIRGIQAIGGALVMGNATTIVADAFPREELGLALGINSIVIALGQMMGPIIGGLLVTWFSWRWVFWFNVPVGIVGTLWALWTLQDVVVPTHEPRIDYWGNVTYIMGLVALLIGATSGGVLGWSSPMAWVGLGLGLGGFSLFFVVERRALFPLLNFRLFQNRLFTMGNLANLFIAISRGAIVLLFVFYFQGVRGFSPLKAGLLVIPMALAMGITAPISGWLSDRIGARGPATTGSLLVAGGLLGFAATIRVATPYWQIALLMVVVGVGNGLFNSPNTSAIMGSVLANERGMAAGTRTMLLNTGNVFSMALILALMASSLPKSVMMAVLAGESASMPEHGMVGFIAALKLAYWLMASLALISGALSGMRVRNAQAKRSVIDASHREKAS